MNKTQEARIDYINNYPKNTYLHNHDYLKKISNENIFSIIGMFEHKDNKEYNIKK